jgi:hypothetical protein
MIHQVHSEDVSSMIKTEAAQTLVESEVLFHNLKKSRIEYPDCSIEMLVDLPFSETRLAAKARGTSLNKEWAPPQEIPSGWVAQVETGAEWGAHYLEFLAAQDEDFFGNRPVELKKIVEQMDFNNPEHSGLIIGFLEMIETAARRYAKEHGGYRLKDERDEVSRGLNVEMMLHEVAESAKKAAG